jgi:hypothetical protein
MLVAHPSTKALTALLAALLPSGSGPSGATRNQPSRTGATIHSSRPIAVSSKSSEPGKSLLLRRTRIPVGERPQVAPHRGLGWRSSLTTKVSERPRPLGERLQHMDVERRREQPQKPGVPALALLPALELDWAIVKLI